MADDIGYLNISVYNRGMMGYRTPLPLKTRSRTRRHRKRGVFP